MEGWWCSRRPTEGGSFRGRDDNFTKQWTNAPAPSSSISLRQFPYIHQYREGVTAEAICLSLERFLPDASDFMEENMKSCCKQCQINKVGEYSLPINLCLLCSRATVRGEEK